MTLEQLNKIYEAADFGNNAKYSGRVAPMAVNNPAGLQTINIAQAPPIQSVTQSNGLPYLLNQSGDQNQNFSMEEYEKAFANQNTEPPDNFLTRALSGVGDKFSGIMDNKYVQGARNMGSMITDPLMGGLSFLASKVDKFDTLPYVDQQFIKENMGYTGPTIFGENNSGLSKDPFGINTRSLFGNYAEYVDKKNKELQEKEDLGLTLTKIEKQQKKFYGSDKLDIKSRRKEQKDRIDIKEIERENRQKEAREKEAAAKKEREIVARTSQAYYDRAVQTAAGRDPNQGNTVTGYGKSGLGRNPDDRMAKGGRIGYGKGGIVSL